MDFESVQEAVDCRNDPITNRVSTVDIRLLCASIIYEI